MGDFEDTLTFRLFARPSFAEGLSRLFDFSGSMQAYNRNKTANEADVRALTADWIMVGKGMQEAMNQCEKEIAQ